MCGGCACAGEGTYSLQSARRAGATTSSLSSRRRREGRLGCSILLKVSILLRMLCTDRHCSWMTFTGQAQAASSLGRLAVSSGALYVVRSTSLERVPVPLRLLPLGLRFCSRLKSQEPPCDSSASPPPLQVLARRHRRWRVSRGEGGRAGYTDSGFWLKRRAWNANELSLRIACEAALGADSGTPPVPFSSSDGHALGVDQRLRALVGLDPEV